MPNAACRECDRLRAKSLKPEKLDETSRAKVPQARPDSSLGVSSSSGSSRDVQELSALSEPAGVGQSSPKDERIETAKQALSRAEISRRQREKDPEAYKKWNRERMKALRAKRKGG